MRAALPDPSRRVEAPLYRALNPVWARDPLSGEGARRHGGRFNAKGQPALYTAFTVMGAVAEANQIGRPFEPVTLVSYAADINDIFDATSPQHLHARGIDFATLAEDDWRLQMAQNGQSNAQRHALALADLGYRGMIVPSFAKGAALGALNLVLWVWDGLRLIDTEDRLTSPALPTPRP